MIVLWGLRGILFCRVAIRKFGIGARFLGEIFAVGTRVEEISNWKLEISDSGVVVSRGIARVVGWPFLRVAFIDLLCIEASMGLRVSSSGGLWI